MMSIRSYLLPPHRFQQPTLPGFITPIIQFIMMNDNDVHGRNTLQTLETILSLGQTIGAPTVYMYVRYGRSSEVSIVQP